MTKLDYKALKKLADVCRKAGIKHFKNCDMEFTLSDEGPIESFAKRPKSKSLNNPPEQDELAVNENTLTEDQILFYSVASLEEESGNTNEGI